MENKNDIADYMKLATLREKFEGKYFKLIGQSTHITYLIFIEKIFIEKDIVKYDGSYVNYKGNGFSFKVGKFNLTVGEQVNFKEITKKEYRKQLHNNFDKLF